MNLPPKAIQELREIIKEEYRQEISEDEGVGMATRLLHLMDLITRPSSPDARPPLQ